MRESQVIRSKKSNFIIKSKFIVVSNFFVAQFFYQYFVETTTTDVDMLLQV